MISRLNEIGTSGSPGVPIALVAAVASNGVIGRDNDLPWRISGDLRRFRDITLGKPLIIGRKNHLSIGRALPGRETIVLTRDATFRDTGVHVASSVEQALDSARRIAVRIGSSEIVCAGGGEIYRAFFEFASLLRLTEVDAVPVGDVFFPAYEASEWRETFREDHAAGPGDEYPYCFRDLERVGGK